MAGGTWTSQNKVRPGVYIRFKSAPESLLTVGERGTVTICEPLSWGPMGQVMELEAGADFTPYTGYDATAPQNRFLNEIFKGTNRTAPPKKVLLYRPAAAGAAQASAVVGEGDSTLTVEALYMGARGNDISVAVTALPPGDGAETALFQVSTIVDGTIADQQTVETIGGLEDNGWVTFSGAAETPPAPTTGVPLTGGADGTVQSAAYAAYLSVIEPYSFDILIYDGADSTVQDAMTAFIKRIAEENGSYAQLVAANLTAPDSRFVINVCSGVTLSDGTVLTPQQVTWWAGGAQAGAKYNESLTYAAYPGAVTVSPKLTNTQYAAALAAGKLVLTEDGGKVKVEQDIDTLTTFTPDIGKVFRKNRVMRLCSTIANDIYRQFSANYIGVVNNNAEGRSRFKADIVGYLLDIQANQGIQNFTADDVEVLPGTELDAVLINLAVQAVDAVEKIYMTVEVS